MTSFIHPPTISHISGDHRRETPANLVYTSSYVRKIGLCKDRRRDRSLICSRVKDVEARVSNLGENLMLYGQFSVSVKETEEEKEKQKYYVNVGDAIRTLREEFPEIFYRELSFGIYRDDIVFKDPLNTFVGIENYKSIFWALRFQGKVFFKALWVDIVSVWQPMESIIMIRWTVHGIPRVPWDSRGRFDGTSEYKLDKDGKIYEHRVLNIALNAPPRFRVLSVDQLIQSLGCPSTPKPTYFEIASLSSIRNIMPLSEKVMEQSRLGNQAMTYDEVSMEQSKSFVKALQELKNLRPQLYSAAEYCEKSYLHSEQKQMVLDNLKDYAVRALVNAVDHLGTVAYKLTDLLDQQNLDVSSVDVKLSCLDQQLLTCQTYTDKEGLRQQQLLAIIPRHHKHYILPNSVNKKVHFSPQIQVDARQTLQSRPRFPSGTPAANTLSWHLASETKSTLKGTPQSSVNTEDSRTSGTTSGAFRLLDAEEGSRTKYSAANLHLPKVGPASAAAMHTLGVTRDPLDSSKPMTAFRSFEDPTRRAIVRTPARSKSMLSSFFVKQKTRKLKT